ncbi:MAG: thioredoxin family protein [Acidobacteriota bacterium]
MRRLRWTSLVLAALVPTVFSTAVAADETPLDPGWAGPDLAAAERLARETGQPILVLVRQPRCVPCDDLERLVTEDPQFVPLIRPFIRMRIDLHDEAGGRAAEALGVKTVPAILFLGPGGLEATRREKRIERSWLSEQLQVIARRHGSSHPVPAPDAAALRASLDQLMSWGDRDGAARLRARLEERAGEATPPAAMARANPKNRSIATAADVDRFLDQQGDPATLRRAAFDLATDLDRRGDPGVALHALESALHRLGLDPLTAARAGFFAARSGIRVEEMRQTLMAARRRDPRSVPQLLALARLAESSGRLYQAFHALEAAAIYSPEDAWVAMELYRLQLLVHLDSRRSKRPDPT